MLRLREEKASASGELFDGGSSLRKNRQSGTIDEGKDAGRMMEVSCHQRVHKIIYIPFIEIHVNLIRAKSKGIRNDKGCMNIKKK